MYNQPITYGNSVRFRYGMGMDVDNSVYLHKHLKHPIPKWAGQGHASIKAPLRPLALCPRSFRHATHIVAKSCKWFNEILIGFWPVWIRFAYKFCLRNNHIAIIRSPDAYTKQSRKSPYDRPAIRARPHTHTHTNHNVQRQRVLNFIYVFDMLNTCVCAS